MRFTLLVGPSYTTAITGAVASYTVRHLVVAILIAVAHHLRGNAALRCPEFGDGRHMTKTSLRLDDYHLVI